MNTLSVYELSCRFLKYYFRPKLHVLNESVIEETDF
jgi:hypothetical protein